MKRSTASESLLFDTLILRKDRGFQLCASGHKVEGPVYCSKTVLLSGGALMPSLFTTTPIISTRYAPLVALGFWVRQLDLWTPIRSRVQLTQPTHTTDPLGALLDLAVG